MSYKSNAVLKEVLQHLDEKLLPPELVAVPDRSDSSKTKVSGASNRLYNPAKIQRRKQHNDEVQRRERQQHKSLIHGYDSHSDEHLRMFWEKKGEDDEFSNARNIISNQHQQHPPSRSVTPSPAAAMGMMMMMPANEQRRNKPSSATSVRSSVVVSSSGTSSRRNDKSGKNSFLPNIDNNAASKRNRGVAPSQLTDVGNKDDDDDNNLPVVMLHSPTMHDIHDEKSSEHDDTDVGVKGNEEEEKKGQDPDQAFVDAPSSCSSSARTPTQKKKEEEQPPATFTKMSPAQLASSSISSSPASTNSYWSSSSSSVTSSAGPPTPSQLHPRFLSPKKNEDEQKKAGTVEEHDEDTEEKYDDDFDDEFDDGGADEEQKSTNAQQGSDNIKPAANRDDTLSPPGPLSGGSTQIGAEDRCHSVMVHASSSDIRNSNIADTSATSDDLGSKNTKEDATQHQDTKVASARSALSNITSVSSATSDSSSSSRAKKSTSRSSTWSNSRESGRQLQVRKNNNNDSTIIINDDKEKLSTAEQLRRFVAANSSHQDDESPHNNNDDSTLAGISNMTLPSVPVKVNQRAIDKVRRIRQTAAAYNQLHLANTLLTKVHINSNKADEREGAADLEPSSAERRNQHNMTNLPEPYADNDAEHQLKPAVAILPPPPPPASGGDDDPQEQHHGVGFAGIGGMNDDDADDLAAGGRVHQHAMFVPTGAGANKNNNRRMSTWANAGDFDDDRDSSNNAFEEQNRIMFGSSSSKKLHRPSTAPHKALEPAIRGEEVLMLCEFLKRHHDTSAPVSAMSRSLNLDWIIKAHPDDIMAYCDEEQEHKEEQEVRERNDAANTNAQKQTSPPTSSRSSSSSDDESFENSSHSSSSSSRSSSAARPPPPPGPLPPAAGDPDVEEAHHAAVRQDRELHKASSSSGQHRRPRRTIFDLSQSVRDSSLFRDASANTTGKHRVSSPRSAVAMIRHSCSLEVLTKSGVHHNDAFLRSSPFQKRVIEHAEAAKRYAAGEIVDVCIDEYRGICAGGAGGVTRRRLVGVILKTMGSLSKSRSRNAAGGGRPPLHHQRASSAPLEKQQSQTRDAAGDDVDFSKSFLRRRRILDSTFKAEAKNVMRQFDLLMRQEDEDKAHAARMEQLKAEREAKRADARRVHQERAVRAKEVTTQLTDLRRKKVVKDIIESIETSKRVVRLQDARRLAMRERTALEEAERTCLRRARAAMGNVSQSVRAATKEASRKRIQNRQSEAAADAEEASIRRRYLEGMTTHEMKVVQTETIDQLKRNLTVAMI